MIWVVSIIHLIFCSLGRFLDSSELCQEPWLRSKPISPRILLLFQHSDEVQVFVYVSILVNLETEVVCMVLILSLNVFKPISNFSKFLASRIF